MGFSYECDVSDCTRRFTNIQSYKLHARDQHAWFCNTHVKQYDKNASSSDPFLLAASNDEEVKDSSLEDALMNVVNNGSDLTRSCNVKMGMVEMGRKYFTIKILSKML